MRTWVLAAALLLSPLASPLVAAGSSADPEIVDASGDSVSTQDGLGAPAADITKAWIQDDAENVYVSVELGNPVCADPTETIEYRFFLTAADEVAFGADIFGMGGFCTVAASDTTIEATGAASGASFEGNVISLTVPRSAFGDIVDGDVLTGFYGTSRAYVGAPEAWNDSDRAPDADAGRPYVVGGAAERILDALLGDANASLVLGTQDPVDDLWVVNWTSAGGPHAIGFELNATAGEVGFLVADATGDPLWQCACEADSDVRTVNGTAGNWTLMVEARGFAGSFRLDIERLPERGPGNETAPAPDAGPEGNATDDQGTSANSTAGFDGNTTAGRGDKGAPMPLATVVAAITLVAWVRRRR